MKQRPRILFPPTQFKFLIEISRIGFPGNLIEICISLDSASNTESESSLEYQKKLNRRKISSSEFSLVILFVISYHKLLHTNVTELTNWPYPMDSSTLMVDYAWVDMTMMWLDFVEVLYFFKIKFAWVSKTL